MYGGHRSLRLNYFNYLCAFTLFFLPHILLLLFNFISCHGFRAIFLWSLLNSTFVSICAFNDLPRFGVYSSYAPCPQHSLVLIGTFPVTFWCFNHEWAHKRYHVPSTLGPHAAIEAVFFYQQTPEMGLETAKLSNQGSCCDKIICTSSHAPLVLLRCLINTLHVR